MTDSTSMPAPEKIPFWRHPTIRAYGFQALVLAGLVLLALVIYRNTLVNLTLRGINTGFGFLLNEAGFGIGETSSIPVINPGFFYFIASTMGVTSGLFLLFRSLIQAEGNGKNRIMLTAGALLFTGSLGCFYTSISMVETYTYTHASTYVTALFTGLINTLKVSVLGCVLSTFLGLFIALAGLSPNWLLKKLAHAYIEINRNIPVLMHLFFWYFIVFQRLPGVRKSASLFDTVFFNNRGVYLPRPVSQENFALFFVAVFLSLVIAFFWWRHGRKHLGETGRQIPVVIPCLGAVIGLPALVCLFTGAPFHFDYPVLKGFNFRGGMTLTPEFMALVTGLTVYVSAFNAEIIRSGIQSVSKGQTEAGRALSMSESRIMRLVILPQALRVIIPPMTSEYLAIAKNSSLAVAIGYPDLVSIGGTILNQTGQSIEVIGIWMAVYLIISLIISIGMNWYNAKIRLIQR
ncbi:MAG: ABC transporter permease subunit [Desulfobacteraceae bacterium]|nr:ABC transporter permease subunit [Desulfobacteraceae bacterium]